MAKKVTAKTLNDKAAEIMQMANNAGVEQNFFYTTTFNRYLNQIKILQQLEKELEGQPMLITKEYVKGRGNVYTHPGITEYNKTCTAANNTAITLIKIVTALSENGLVAENEENL